MSSADITHGSHVSQGATAALGYLFHGVISSWIGLLSFGATWDLFAENRPTINRCALLDSGLVAPLALDAPDV
jgi:hypothetical protein